MSEEEKAFFFEHINALGGIEETLMKIANFLEEDLEIYKNTPDNDDVVAYCIQQAVEDCREASMNYYLSFK